MLKLPEMRCTLHEDPPQLVCEFPRVGFLPIGQNEPQFFRRRQKVPADGAGQGLRLQETPFQIARAIDRVYCAHRFLARFTMSLPPRVVLSNRMRAFTAFCAPCTRLIARESARGLSGFRRRLVTHFVPGAT